MYLTIGAIEQLFVYGNLKEKLKLFLFGKLNFSSFLKTAIKNIVPDSEST